MAKIKNAKNRNADKNKSKDSVKKLNPFEVHINKQKFQVLGQKTKNDRGLPGVSRERAINKRKNTLLPEFNLRNKTNQFLDRRIGEKNRDMTAEDRTIARFTAERVKLHKKKSIFNLGDDEILTHRGQTLNEIEKFDDPRSEDEFDDEDDDKQGGRLTKKFVAEAHFGGGLLSNTGKEGVKSRKDLIEQLIIESKKRKAEKQQTREETIQLTEKLDQEWKDLIPLVNKKKKIDDEPAKKETDDYDKMMLALKFEARGIPSDRLKTEDEIAKEEKERLEQLEQDRLARMKGFVNGKDAAPKHRSADDLDDDFVVASDAEEEVEDDVKNGDVDSESEDEDSNDEEDESGGEESGDDLSDLKEDESESGSDDSDNENNDESLESEQEDLTSKPTPKKVAHKTKLSEPEESKNSEPEESDNSEPEESDNSEPEESEHSEPEVKPTKKSKQKEIIKNVPIKRKIEKEIIPEKVIKKTKLFNGKKDVKDEEVIEPLNDTPTLEEKVREDLLFRKKIMEDARDELPYTFSVPETYEEFDQLITPKSLTHQTMIIDRMIKCNHPSLSEHNKSKLSNLFAYLLQFINDLSIDVKSGDDVLKCFNFVDHIIPLLYDLAQINPTETSEAIVEILKEKQSNYRNKRKKFPGLDTLIYLKIISLLFPTSDFRHRVVTPAIVFMDQLLTWCRVKTRRDIGIGLFLVTLILEYVTLSKRFLPSVTNFLRGILHMAVPKTSPRAIPVIPPFKTFNSLLVLTETHPVTNYYMTASDLVLTEINSDFKIRAIHLTLKLSAKFYEMYEPLPSSVELFQPIFNLLQQFPVEKYPDTIQMLVKSLETQIETGKKCKKLDYLIVAASKPKALRLYEPDIQQVFENRKHRNIPKERADREKLLHKLKREKKGALREIRRDNAFISNLKINRQMQSDVERKEKVKEILSGASIQQGELNAIDRKKKK